MKARSRRLQQKQKGLKACVNFYEYLWFCYHQKFFGALIKHGRKATAFNFLLRVKAALKAKEFFDVYYVFLVAMLQITPSLVIIQGRLGASSQGVPFPLSAKKRITFAVKWIVKLLRDRHGSVTIRHLVELLHNSLYRRGEAIERKRSFHRLALANRFLIRRFFR